MTVIQGPVVSASSSKSRKSDDAYLQLKEMILKGRLAPGSLIEEPSLCAQIGTSRTPVREALQKLAHDELVESWPRRGYIVAPIRAADLHDIFEMRSGVEAQAARLAAARRRDADLEAFDQFFETARQGIADGNVDLDWNLAHDELFHRLVARSAGNPYIMASVSRLHGLAIRALYVTGTPMTLVRDEMENFINVVDAIRRQDEQGASDAMKQHLGTGDMTWIDVEINRRRATVQ
ncbi:MAG: GntR family transcriptional regulator [Alphaproteobacteria bacterium]